MTFQLSCEAIQLFMVVALLVPNILVLVIVIIIAGAFCLVVGLKLYDCSAPSIRSRSYCMGIAWVTSNRARYHHRQSRCTSRLLGFASYWDLPIVARLGIGIRKRVTLQYVLWLHFLHFPM